MEELFYWALFLSVVCLSMVFAMAWWISDSEDVVHGVVGVLMWFLMMVFSSFFLVVVVQSNWTVAGLVIFTSAAGFFMPTAKKMISRG